MSVILNILCEGQTEDRFAQKVLKEHLKSFNVIVKTSILITSKKKNERGGLLSYVQAKNDLVLWTKQRISNSNEAHYFTTMFDFYALSNDFPGYAEAHRIHESYQKIEMLEKRFEEDLSLRNFIPYLQLHEFEALVFCGLEHLLIDYPNKHQSVTELKKVLSKYGNPEKINNSHDTAPSKRIEKLFEKYNKPKLGALVTSKVGITALKQQCRHFGEWVNKLEQLKQSELWG